MASQLPCPLQFVPECEVVSEGDKLDTLNMECNKNPGHPRFFSMSELKDHLPEEMQNEDFMDYIQSLWDRTVKVLVKYTSLNRPDTYENSPVEYPYAKMKGSKRKRRYGTGIINMFDSSYSLERVKEQCPCPLCEGSGQPKMVYWKIDVTTATHVIYDDSEAKKAVFTCFYDSDKDKENPDHCLYGHKFTCKSDDDTCDVECVTHNAEFAYSVVCKLVPSITHLKKSHRISFPQGYTGILISHPHGLSKRISFGDIDDFVVETDPKVEPEVPCEFPADTFCLLPAMAKQEAQESAASNTDVQMSSVSISIPAALHEKEEIKVPVYNSSSDVIKPEQPYRLPQGTTFTTPPNAGYLYTIKYTPLFDTNYAAIAEAVNSTASTTTTSNSSSMDSVRQGKSLSTRNQQYSAWKTYPPGTKFTLTSGELVSFPPNMLFHCYLPLEEIVIDTCRGFLTYDISTCPGSSGGMLVTQLKRVLSHLDTHAGAVSSRINRTGPMRRHGLLFDVCRWHRNTANT